MPARATEAQTVQVLDQDSHVNSSWLDLAVLFLQCKFYDNHGVFAHQYAFAEHVVVLWGQLWSAQDKPSHQIHCCLTHQRRLVHWTTLYCTLHVRLEEVCRPEECIFHLCYILLLHVIYIYTVHKLCSAVTISSQHKYYGLRVTILSHQVWHVHVEDAILLNVKLHAHSLPQVCPCMSIEKDLEPRQWLPYPGENAGVRSYDGGEGLHGSGSHMHCWFIQHAQQLQRKKWAQCTHGCYKMTWRYLTSEAISYD